MVTAVPYSEVEPPSPKSQSSLNDPLNIIRELKNDAVHLHVSITRTVVTTPVGELDGKVISEGTGLRPGY